MRIEQIMTHNVLTTSKDTKIIDAAKKMTKAKVSCLLVMEKDELLGIVTERDFVGKVLISSKGNAKIKDVMTTKVTTIKETQSLLLASSVMKYERIKQLPVVSDAGKVTGIVTQSDIVWSLHDALYLFGFSKHEIWIAFAIFILMVIFFELKIAIIFLAFIFFSQLNVVHMFPLKIK